MLEGCALVNEIHFLLNGLGECKEGAWQSLRVEEKLSGTFYKPRQISHLHINIVDKVVLI